MVSVKANPVETCVNTVWYAAKYNAAFTVLSFNLSCLITSSSQDEVIAVKDELTQAACLPEGSTSPGSMRQVIWATSLRDYESIFNEHINHGRDY